MGTDVHSISNSPTTINFRDSLSDAGRDGMPPTDSFVASSPEFDDCSRFLFAFEFCQKQCETDVVVARITASMLGQVERSYAVLWLEQPSCTENGPQPLLPKSPEEYLMRSFEKELRGRDVLELKPVDELASVLTSPRLAELSAAGALLVCAAPKHRAIIDPFEDLCFMVEHLKIEGVVIELVPSKTSLSANTDMKDETVELESATERAELLDDSAGKLVANLVRSGVVRESDLKSLDAMHKEVSERIKEYMAQPWTDSSGASHDLLDARRALAQAGEQMSSKHAVAPWSDAIAHDLFEIARRFCAQELDTAALYRARQSLGEAVNFFLIDCWLPLLPHYRWRHSRN